MQEVRAWTIANGFTASQAAGVIHTDFEKGFIRAEVIKYDDFIKYGSEAAVKEAGKLRVEGKTYVVQDGDIMHFRFNVQSRSVPIIFVHPLFFLSLEPSLPCAYGRIGGNGRETA